MNLPKTKILLFFSLGLNAGFIIFIIFHLALIPEKRKKKILHFSQIALKEVKATEEEKNKILHEVRFFDDKIKNIHENMHEKRIRLLYLYTQTPKNLKKIELAKKEIAQGAVSKDGLFAEHIENLDSILGKNSSGYFKSIHRQITEHFKEK